MDSKKILLYSGTTLLGAALARYVYQNAVLAKQWDYEIAGYRVLSIAPTIKVELFFVLKNASAFKATIKDIDISIFSMGKKLTNIVQAGPYEIQADGNTKISVKIEVLPKTLAENWEVFLTEFAKTKDLPLDFVGKMKLKTFYGWATIPIRFSTTGKSMYQLYKETYGK